MEARLQVSQTPTSVLGTAPAPKEQSGDGFEAALASANASAKGPVEAASGQPVMTDGELQEKPELSDAEVVDSGADAPSEQAGTDKQFTEGDVKDALPLSAAPAGESAVPAPGATVQKSTQGSEIQPPQTHSDQTPLPNQQGEAQVATGAGDKRQQSAPGKAVEPGPEVETRRGNSASPTEVLPTRAAEAVRAVEVGKTLETVEPAKGKQPSLEQVQPVARHPSAKSDHPNSDAPGVKVAGEAAQPKGPTTPAPDSVVADAKGGDNGEGAQSSSEPGEESIQVKSGKAAAAASPFALLSDGPALSDGEAAPVNGVAPEADVAVTKGDGAAQGKLAADKIDGGRGDAPSPQPKVKPGAPLKGEAGLQAQTAQPAPPAEEAPPEQQTQPVSAQTEAKATAGSELLAQLQGSRQVQSKLEGEAPLAKLGAASGKVTADDGGTPALGVPAPQKGGAERLEPELAKEAASLQISAGKVEPGLRSGQPSAEFALQPQLQEPAPLQVSADHGEALELDSAHRLHQPRATETRLGAQTDPQAAMRQPVAAERMAPELRERMMMMINSRTNQAEIRLDPPELGALQVKIQMQGDQAQVQLHVQQAQTREMVEQALPRLREMLAQQGITLADTQVSHGGGGQADGQGGEPGAEGGVAADGLVEASDDTLAAVQQMTGRNADGGIDYYA